MKTFIIIVLFVIVIAQANGQTIYSNQYGQPVGTATAPTYTPPVYQPPPVAAPVAPVMPSLTMMPSLPMMPTMPMMPTLPVLR